MTEIVRTREDIEDGIKRKFIFGLNLLSDEVTHSSYVLDPRIKLIHELSTRCQTCVLLDPVRDDNDLLGSMRRRSESAATCFGFFGGEFVKLEDSDLKQMLFEKLNPEILIQPLSADPFFNELYEDTLVLFVGPRGGNSYRALCDLLAGGSPANTILSEACKLYSLVVTTAADADYFLCFTDDDFYCLDESLAATTSYVEKSEWFIRNSGKLIWDDKFNMCLVIDR